ncbi:hypothetical protein AAV99_05145 [Aurantiacibacter marinus]|uniref:DUF1501 domain-containing protein n=2 Tax=Aurantiacibacter marinus TaxID=874156 RepID=A0A0H0XTH1_9SPHN|nr:hypothetical protein AAV99_05145 [Aurantiacibacter marinus]
MLLASAIAGAGIAFPRTAFAAGQDKRFVFVLQRGAADGLALVQPHGDPALRSLRERLVNEDAHPLDGFFALHPALVRTAQMFDTGEARAWHAVATGYRQRSHFDAQNVLESGNPRPYASRTGWLGRLLPLLPGAPGPLALSAAVPLTLRGDIQVGTYAPNRLPDPSEDLLNRVAMMYGEDAALGPLWDEAMRTRMLASDIGDNAGRGGQQIGELASSLMMAEGGPRVMMVETGGWDTHQGQPGRLNQQLRGLDGLLGSLRDGLGDVWNDTIVLVATEFGRTAAINGSLGTDHGTASAALLLGGALPSGAKVIADWPGLASNQLYEGRDLRPTGDLLALATGAVAEHFGIDPARALAALGSA